MEKSFEEFQHLAAWKKPTHGLLEARRKRSNFHGCEERPRVPKAASWERCASKARPRSSRDEAFIWCVQQNWGCVQQHLGFMRRMGSSKGAHPAFNWRSTHTLRCMQQLGEILVQQQGRSEAAGPAACGGNRREVQQRPTHIQGETRLGERGQQHTAHTWCIQ
ncbi:hypothetical protein VIGAN_UM000400 [Vigna angularis var. angularis]|uniref:Uncharacterized protein n=1 Tax=Vigna angularis var. angularis TaxID=157739 RepID=A0A0S3TD50_PHAAN|nr:hypothetical protein VIGAN_UM000400 [Vigna angularis var. angularis]